MSGGELAAAVLAVATVACYLPGAVREWRGRVTAKEAT